MTKILIVEDNEMNRDMISRRLERKGFETAIAIDGQQALDMVESYNPDLILMDMSLPIVDGWEATKTIKQNVSSKDIPVVGLSAHARDIDIIKGMNAGCDAYETKPIEFPRLLSTINSLINLTK